MKCVTCQFGMVARACGQVIYLVGVLLQILKIAHNKKNCVNVNGECLGTKQIVCISIGPSLGN